MAAQLATFNLVVEKFKSGLSVEERKKFAVTTLEDLHIAIETIQHAQHSNKKQRGMARLELFLEGMKEYDKVVSVFLNTSTILAFVWGPMKFLLQIACTFHEAFDALMDAYQRIGEHMPLLAQYEDYFRHRPQMVPLLRLLYEDILNFHQRAMKYFKKRMWQQLFQALWKSFDTEFAAILRNMREHMKIIEAQTTLIQFSEILETRAQAEKKFAQDREDEVRRQRIIVYQWLAAANCGADQETYAKIRGERTGSGEWLLQESRFRSWFDPAFCSTHLLWMNGIPGAGKTVLASLVIEEAKKYQDVHVAFFYCRYLDSERNTFLAVARGILAQLLSEDDALLTYLYDKVSTSGQVTLSLEKTAEELLKTSLKAFEKLYIVIDGIDECERDQRQQIVSFFKRTWESLPQTDADSLRCMFVSQDDSIARRDFANMSSFKVTENHTRHDINAYVAARSMAIKTKFELTTDRQQWIQNQITKSADGMFLFAHLMTAYLIDQNSRAELDNELSPEKLPQGGTRLEEIYSRIIKRLYSSQGSLNSRTLQLLTWLVCAKRPLQWREIQCAVSINLDDQTVDWEHNRFRVDSKDLGGSLIDIHVDQTVTLVHHSAKRYLLENNLVTLGSGEGDLALLCMEYLCFDGFDIDDDNVNIPDYIPSGYYGFMDYAYAYWARHLDGVLRSEDPKDALQKISEQAEVFVDMNWKKPQTKTIPPKSFSARWAPLSNNRNFEKIVVAGHLAHKQLIASTLHTPELQTLKLYDVLLKVRGYLESEISATNASEKLHHMYGKEIFKCPRVNCIRFYSGFESRKDRDTHISKHERSFFCSFPGCHMATFGCSTLKELHKHEIEFHNAFDNDDDDEFPELPPQKVSFDCKECDAKFTRNHNLKIHIRSQHSGSESKPTYVCSTCSKSFARKGDCTRHETTAHSDSKSFVCKGELKDGSDWGCGRVFNRGDVLNRHWKSAKGKACILPKQKEEEAENTVP